MLNKLLKIFSKKESPKSKSLPESVKPDIKDFFIEQLNMSPYIKTESHELVLAHLCNKVNLNKTGNKLTVKEKKALGMNTRLSITPELVEVLTPEGIAQKDPKKILTSIFYRATFKKQTKEELKKYKELDIKEITLLGAEDEGDCEWCKSQYNVKLPTETDLCDLIEKNCTCDSHCRLCVQATIDI